MGLANTTLVLMAAVFTTSASEDLIVDTVDLIELNHCYDDAGKHVFDQVIFYDWSANDRRYRVLAWRMLKQQAQIPRHDNHHGGFEATWHDGQVFRRVRATTFRETWTQHDPELAARAHVPKEERRELYRPRPQP